LTRPPPKPVFLTEDGSFAVDGTGTHQDASLARHRTCPGRPRNRPGAPGWSRRRSRSWSFWWSNTRVARPAAGT